MNEKVQTEDKTKGLAMKKTFYTELAYVCGLIILAFGTAFMEKAAFGVSMIVAPAYILHLKISQYFSFFSFGMAEYTVQAVLIIIVAIICRRFHRSYLFSFVTAVIYGFVLDGAMGVVAFIPFATMIARIIYFTGGMILCAIGVAFFFHTYISPEAYELFVKEVSIHINMPLNKLKTIYDCASCVIAIAFSFIFFGVGKFEGISYGTVICAVLNGWLIGRASAVMNRVFEFRDGLTLRKYFES